jgi:hypothetical protein
MKIRNLREALITGVTFLGGAYFVLEFLLSESVLDAWGISSHHESITNGFLAAIYVSVGLGIINLCMVHGSKIAFRRPGAAFSGILLSGLFAMTIVSTADWLSSLSDARKTRNIEVLSLFADAIITDATAQRKDVPPTELRVRAFIPALIALEAQIAAVSAPEIQKELITVLGTQLRDAITSLETAPTSLKTVATLPPLLSSARTFISAQTAYDRENRLSRRLFSLLFDGVFTSLGSSMFALLAFYLAAAAYRAFRVTSIESLLMMVAALLVILGQTSVGLMISESFGSVRLWLLEVPSAGVFRAIKLGAGVASLVLCIRMWFSVEAKGFTGGADRG